MPRTCRPLTAKQSAIFDFIKDRIVNRGYGPSVREIATHFNIHSPNAVMCHLKALEKKGCIARDKKYARAIVLVDRTVEYSLPHPGVVRAGRPVLAEEQNERMDFSDLFEVDNYTLTVEGDSMIGEGIKPSDLVIVQRSHTAQDGDIVVAMADGEQTIKRLRRKGRRIMLVPANPDMEAWSPDELEILGVVIGVVRRVKR